MKLIFSLLALVTVSPCFGFVVGTLRGNCRVPQGDFSFQVGPNEKSVLGYVGTDSGNYKITVVNNTADHLKEKTWGSLAIGFARDIGGLQNPPLLCPTSPEDLKRKCEKENAINNPEHITAPLAQFTEVENDGSASAEALNPSSPGPYTFTRVEVWPAQLVDGMVVTTPEAKLGGVAASCTATFLQAL